MTNSYNYHIEIVPLSKWTNLGKVFRHLKFNIHWSKRVFSVNEVGERTLGASGHWPDFQEDLKNFSFYYPHVLFIGTEKTQGGVIFECGFLAAGKPGCKIVRL